MRIVVQRVKEASVKVDGKIVGKSVNKVNGATMDMEMRQVGL